MTTESSEKVVEAANSVVACVPDGSENDEESGNVKANPSNHTTASATTSTSIKVMDALANRKAAPSRRASTTEERRNPFAKREGNALIWSGVTMTLVSTQLCRALRAPSK